MIWKKIATFFRLIQKKDFEAIQIFILRKMSSFILPKYRFKWPQIDWWDNVLFNQYLEKFDEIRGFNTDRRWMLSQFIRLTAKIPGDTVECGVYRGAGSYIICKMNEKSSSQKNHHIFDSFEGVSSPGKFDGNHWEKGSLACSESDVRENMKEFPYIYIYIRDGFQIDFLKLQIKNSLLFILTWTCFSRQKIAWNSFIRGLKRAELLFVMIMVSLFALEPLKPAMNFSLINQRKCLPCLGVVDF